MRRFWRVASSCALIAACGAADGGDENDASCGAGGEPSAGDAGDDGGQATAPPRIIVMIGDGMGKTLERAASGFAHGDEASLRWHSFAHQGELVTASLSGITDSAAAASAMATGVLTYNGRVAIDRDGRNMESIFEVAKRAGLATGVVTTANLPHATIAPFTAHALDRYDYPAIAAQQVASGTDVMLGGGRDDFGPALLAELASQNATIAFDATSLASAVSENPSRLIGLFAAGHFPYVRDRQPADDLPDLATMTRAALDVLDRNPNGFLLVVESARIDRSCHDRQLDLAIDETLELDAAVSVADDWSATREGVSLLVLADHETGGLDIAGPVSAGDVPAATWRWGDHTNRRVNIYGGGDPTAVIDNASHDARIVYEVIHSAISSQSIDSPSRVLVANGVFDDVRLEATLQDYPSDFGQSGRLDRLVVDADHYGVTIGIEGLFSRSSSSLTVLVDSDFGGGTGATSLASLSSPTTDPVDILLARLVLDVGVITGFGVDYAAVSVAGIEDTLERSWSGAGWRAVRASDGMPQNPARTGIAINYDDGVRDGAATSGSGIEVTVPFDRLFPALDGSIPIGAEVGILGLLTSVLGGTVSSQALPSFAGGEPASVGGVIVLELDRNGDGVVDSALRARVVLP